MLLLSLLDLQFGLTGTALQIRCLLGKTAQFARYSRTALLEDGELGLKFGEAAAQIIGFDAQFFASLRPQLNLLLDGCLCRGDFGQRDFRFNERSVDFGALIHESSTL